MRLRPFDARLDIDLRCNYRCHYCWTDHDSFDENPTMSADLLDRIFPFLGHNCWHVYLSCAGEPLLHPDFLRIMDSAKRHLSDTDVTIITNGWRLDEEYAGAIVDAEITSVAVSIDTIDSGKYSSIVGISNGNPLNRVMENTERLVAIRGGKKFPKVIVNAVVMQSTLDGLLPMARWIDSSGLDGLRLLWLMPLNEEMRQKEYVGLTPESLQRILEVKQYLSNRGLFFDYPFLKNWRKVGSVLKAMSFNKNRLEYLSYAVRKFLSTVTNRHCGIAGQSVFIDRSGIVSVCPDNLRPLGLYSEMAPDDFERRVRTDISQITESRTCVSCSMYKSRKLTESKNVDA